MRINKLWIIILLFLSGCASQQDKLYSKLSKGDKILHIYPGHYKVSTTAAGKKYDHPNKLTKFTEVGKASWYGMKKSFHNKTTANGDQFNMNSLTAAHKTLPIPSMVKVTNLKNNESLIVMINDRGPYTKGRIIDVSSKAAELLKFKQQGIANVKIEYLEKDTNELLKKLALKPQHGSKPKGKIENHKCSINCHVKLANMKYGFKIE